MSGTIGPAAAVVVDVVHPGIRATAASVLALTQNLLGLAVGPLLAGLLSDAYGLPFAMSVVPLFSIVAAAVFLFAVRSYEADLSFVENARPPSRVALEPQSA
jgi:MFS family permease